MTEANGVIASASVLLIKVIKTLSSGYQIPDPLPWAQLAGPLAAAEDALARLDERLAKSAARDGWVARTHYTDACASLWLSGELVRLEDLVLHDAGMDIRAPTHELTRARAVLRIRRRIAAAKPDWALSAAGLAGLRGQAGQGDREEGSDDRKEGTGDGGGANDAEDTLDGEDLNQPLVIIETDPRLAAAFPGGAGPARKSRPTAG